jgi:N-acetyl-anhydromuramyl-L-alanine amidase AmpD
MTLGYIVVRGKSVPVRAVVHGFDKTGMHFTALARTSKCRVVINHWTGAENPPAKLFENMRRSRLSVHFACDVTGELWQFMDAEAYGAHCRGYGANAYSVGIEFICRGSNFGAPNNGIIRKRRFDVLHGTRVAYDDLTLSQIFAGVALNEALCGAYGLPMRVPEQGADVYTGVLSARQAAIYEGCAGHLNFEPKKHDPGATLLRAIRDCGRGIEGPPLGVA